MLILATMVSIELTFGGLIKTYIFYNIQSIQLVHASLTPLLFQALALQGLQSSAAPTLVITVGQTQNFCFFLLNYIGINF